MMALLDKVCQVKYFDYMELIIDPDKSLSHIRYYNIQYCAIEKTK